MNETVEARLRRLLAKALRDRRALTRALMGCWLNSDHKGIPASPGALPGTSLDRCADRWECRRCMVLDALAYHGARPRRTP